MQTVRRFFSWWWGTFRSRGNKGKAGFGCLSLFVVLTICAIPLAIISPSEEATPIPNPTATNGAIGYDAHSNSYVFSGKMQEILFFADNEDTNNSGISTNINDFYSIY